MLLCPTCGLAYRAPYNVCPRDNVPLLPPEELDPRLGSQIANYTLIEFLGKGGMGVVYRGEHIYLHKQVAIKVLHEKYASQSEAVARFLAEARAAATIGHPNIVDVSDFGETSDGAAYFIMELVSGRPLDQVLQEDGALPLLRAINILNQVGRALSAAHEKGIVHRDLKPENVMMQKRPGRRDIVRRTGTNFSVEKEGEYDFVKLLDFGVAKMIGAPTGQTESGTIFGTPEYMAPEAARGLPVDHRADVYAFGILFYEMLTMFVPFDGATPMDVLMAQVHKAPPPPSRRNPRAKVSAEAERLILWCLEKDPDKRPQSMYEVLESLQQSYGDEVYLRDADRMPGAREAGIAPIGPGGRKRSVTEDLADLFKDGEGGGGKVLEQIELETTEPLLLTQIKKETSGPVTDPAPPSKPKTLLGMPDGTPRGSKFSKKSPKV
jgi:serine/threonine-protein kinase